MKTLIVLSAVPASGKSTWARKYKEEHDNVKIVSSDEIRTEITHSFEDHTQEPLVWKTFEQRIKDYSKIDGVTTILDALNDLNWLRKKYVQENPEYDKYVLVMFAVNKEKSMFYNTQRGKDHIVPIEALEYLINKFEQPDQETLDMFDEVLFVDWSNQIEKKIK